MRRLLIRPGAIGDCILALPALESLYGAFTEVWVPSSVVPLIEFAHCVRAIGSTGLDLVGLGDLAIAPALVQHLCSFDEIVSWYGANRDDFRAALKELGVRCRFLQALPGKESPTHATDFFCSQVGAPPGAEPKLTTSGSVPKRQAIAIHPFSGSATKNWPIDHFRALAGLLPGEVNWIAGPEEVLPDAHRFEDLRQLAEWLSGASLYVGNDSGITHLAAAIGVPTVALFRTTSSAIWAPRGKNVSVIQQQQLEPDRLARIITALLSRTDRRE